MSECTLTRAMGTINGQWLPGVGGREGRMGVHRGRLGQWNAPYVTVTVDTHHYTSAQTHRPYSLSLNSDVNTGPWAVMMCQCGVFLGDECPLAGSGGMLVTRMWHTCGGGGVYEKSPQFPPNFVVDLKKISLLKMYPWDLYICMKNLLQNTHSKIT